MSAISGTHSLPTSGSQTVYRNAVAYGHTPYLRDAVLWLTQPGEYEILRKTTAVFTSIFLCLTIVGIPLVILAYREWCSLTLEAQERQIREVYNELYNELLQELTQNPVASNPRIHEERMQNILSPVLPHRS